MGFAQVVTVSHVVILASAQRTVMLANFGECSQVDKTSRGLVLAMVAQVVMQLVMQLQLVVRCYSQVLHSKCC